MPFPSPGDLPNPGLEPRSPGLQADSLASEPLRTRGPGFGEEDYVGTCQLKEDSSGMMSLGLLFIARLRLGSAQEHRLKTAGLCHLQENRLFLTSPCFSGSSWDAACVSAQSTRIRIVLSPKAGWFGEFLISLSPGGSVSTNWRGTEDNKFS